jgi:uncharacterized protein (TIGR02246 family)
MTKAQAQSAPSSAQDIAAIEALVSAQADAWNQGNAKAFAVRFAEDGSFTNIIGMTFYGREAFEQRHAEIFRTIYKGSSVRFSIQKLRFIRPDVAVVDVDGVLTGYAKLHPGIQAGTDGAIRSKLQVVLTNERGDWWITAYHNVAVIPMPPRL